MPKVTMPQLGETVAEGTVTKWFKTTGDTVEKGEVLFEVSTDKVDTEIPAPAGGTITVIVVAAGETVAVGTVLALIDEDPDDDAPSARAASSRAQTETPATGRPRSDLDSPSDAKLSPVVRRLLAEHRLEPRDLVGSGPGGRITRDDVLAHVAGEDAAAEGDGHGSGPSPVVRRLLRENGLGPGDVVGTGPGGRVQRRDVEAAIATSAQSARAEDEVIPFTTIRRLTAEHMVRSKATSAHTLMVREVDYENVESARRGHGATFKEREGFALTYLPFNAVAAVEALRDFPHLNGSVGDDALVVHRAINLGIAVDLDGQGLVVPVVRDAAALSLTGMASRVRALADGARSKRLTVDDTMNGTFTITNPGPFGTLMTGAIINQPQVAILSTDAVTRKPVVVRGSDGEEGIAIHSIGLVALTFDHRVIDGAYAARFLARLATILETRDWSSEL
jgi:pyruvate/2-oxoglutarate dehydrogenase complex dihydrolipoamide acyltransferase (E2) component